MSIVADYPAWVREHDTLGDADRAAIRDAVADMREPGLISLLLPVGYAPRGELAATVASLTTQLYPHWELIVVGEPHDHREVAALSASDPRIRVVVHAGAPERADAANVALASAEAPHVALLAEGDRLAPHALYEVAAVLSRHPNTDLLYTDEDRMDAGGVRSAPRFKTGWDVDLLYGCDYVGGLAVFSRDVVDACGGWRAGFDGAEGYDLALRASALLLPDRVRHIPSVLYHRPDTGSRPLRDAMLGPDVAAGRRAVAALLGRSVRVVVSPAMPSCSRVIWPVPTSAPKVSVIMPTRDRATLLVPAAWGVLLRTEYPDFELLIVDNDSAEDLTAIALRDLATQPRVRILRHPGAFNFAAINNAAVEQARGDIVVLLNNDIDIITPDWLRELVGHALRPEVGAVGARLLYADGTLQHGGIVLGPGLNAAHMLRGADRADPGHDGQLATARSFSAVTGACMALRRAVYQEVGGMDEVNFAVAFNDVDLCLRLGEFGYRVVWTPFAELFHLESQTRGQASTAASRATESREVNKLWRLWRHAFDSDPFHNPNLACTWDEPPRLCPPRRRKPWRTLGVMA
jgi:GT2 family glycosyltransferase